MKLTDLAGNYIIKLKKKDYLEIKRRKEKIRHARF
jgi:hypothetical protein